MLYVELTSPLPDFGLQKVSDKHCYDYVPYVGLCISCRNHECNKGLAYYNYAKTKNCEFKRTNAEQR